MHLQYRLSFFLLLLTTPLTLALPNFLDLFRLHAVPGPRAVSQLVPTACTDSRSANTEIGCPTTIGSVNPSATTETTTHTAHTQIEPSPGTGTIPALVTTDSRTANTQAVGPSTVPSTTISTAGAHAPTNVGAWDAALGAMVMVGVGMGAMG
ncbi:uncharacterized protein BDZ99DRAFT_514774 [Mytilinidion resinicola]|uniref:GPI anchored protein n=1 Tax=Mytilinidion resinicola TaxID=574789 RepID=A0A6A6Z7D3_9PEZI|nr:uncharacterized protein BDZ99DRAFT_514774 [Mytilinidion resinicola]KAF2816165.1 hypothetical protein BDZ99DRAFT_514774 [Mytilinidion resinicola]